MIRLRYSLGMTLVMLLLFAGCARAQESRPPNVVIILADDLGYGDLSAYGGWIETPHLDRLAREGLRFTDFHTSGTVCSPTRAGLLTGRYQQRAGIPGVIYANPKRNRHHGLQPEEFTSAELVKKEGYATGIIGKWHLGYEKQYSPTYQGFDVFRGYVSGNIDYFSHVDGTGVHDWWKGREKIHEEGYTTDLITRHAVQFIEDHREEPFFLYIAHEAPHYPYQGPDDKAIRKVGGGRTRTPPRRTGDTTYVRSRYRQMVRAMDEGIGRVVQTLKQLDLAEHTLVFFFSDNGPFPYGSAGPLRGWKGSVFEGGHRVPAIAWWPGHIEPGRVSDVLTISLDLMSTVADLLGIAPPRPLDGTSLLPVLLDAQPLSDRTLFWEYRGQQAVRRGSWKLVRNARSWTQSEVILEGVALYNLEEDFDESNNLASVYPERVNDMLAALEAWKEDVTSGATVQPSK